MKTLATQRVLGRYSPDGSFKLESAPLLRGSGPSFLNLSQPVAATIAALSVQ